MTDQTAGLEKRQDRAKCDEATECRGSQRHKDVHLLSPAGNKQYSNCEEIPKCLGYAQL